MVEILGGPYWLEGENVADDETKQGSKAGQPPKYRSAELLAEAINAYFDSLKDDMKPPTVAGLAYALGFCDRQSLYDQEKRGSKFSCVIKRARVYIESCHEAGLYGNSCAGHIFWLKNHAGYVDVQGVNLGGSVVDVDYSTLSDKQKAAICAANEALAEADK